MNGFVKDTLIKTPYGYKEIQRLRVGEVITGINLLNGTPIKTKITAINIFSTNKLSKIRTIENKVVCFKDTKLVRSNNELCRAEDIKERFVVKVFEDKKEKTKLNAIISTVDVEEEQTVYSIKTEQGTFIADNFLTQEQ